MMVHFVIARFEPATKFPEKQLGRAQFLLSKGFNNDTEYAKDDGVSYTARFNFTGSLWSAFEQSLH
jgi:hypothetical protein